MRKSTLAHARSPHSEGTSIFIRGDAELSVRMSLGPHWNNAEWIDETIADLRLVWDAWIRCLQFTIIIMHNFGVSARTSHKSDLII